MQRQLKDTFLRSVKPPASGRLEFSDTKTTGLEFRITAAGARSWSFRYRSPIKEGKPVQRAAIGTYPATPLKKAREQAGVMRGLVEAGRDPIEEQKTANAGTFGRLAERFMAEHSRRHKRSHKADDRNLRLHVLPRWKDRAVSSIKRRDVIELVEGVVAAGKPVAANRVQALISTIFTFGMDAADLEANPCHRLRRRGVETAGTRVLSDDEIRLFWHGVVGPDWPRRIGLGLRLALLTAARVGEVAGMCRSELERTGERSRAAWVIPGTRTKNSKPHVIPLSPLALETVLHLLDMIGPAEQFLFPPRHGDAPMDGNRLTKAMEHFGTAQTWQQPERPTPHDLRRTVETRMAELRIPKETRDRCLNHIPGDVGSKHYNQYDYFGEKSEAFVRWAAVIKSIVSGSSAAIVPIATVLR
jgi:integrase